VIGRRTSVQQALYKSSERHACLDHTIANVYPSSLYHKLSTHHFVSTISTPWMISIQCFELIAFPVEWNSEHSRLLLLFPSVWVLALPPLSRHLPAAVGYAQVPLHLATHRRSCIQRTSLGAIDAATLEVGGTSIQVLFSVVYIMSVRLYFRLLPLILNVYLL